MPFTIRPYRRFPVQFAVTYNAGPLFKLPLAYVLGLGSLILFLVLSSGPVYAEWVRIAKHDQTGATVYVDPDTIRRNGDLVKMWYLYDFKTIQTQSGDSYLSVKGQGEYDCVEERSRVIAFTFFSGLMGSGKVVISNSDERKWVPVEPNSVGQALWKAACRKQ